MGKSVVCVCVCEVVSKYDSNEWGLYKCYGNDATVAVFFLVGSRPPRKNENSHFRKLTKVFL